MVSLKQFLWYVMIPGVVLHEFSHAVAVFISPNARITEVQWTSHVNYESTYSAVSTFCISYAPVAIHTGVVVVCILALPETVFTEQWKDIIVDATLVYVLLTVGASSLPSYEDALSPFQLISSRKGRVWKWLYPRSLFMIVLGAPGLIITYLCHKSVTVQALLTITYTGTVVAIALYPTVFEQFAVQVLDIARAELAFISRIE